MKLYNVLIEESKADRQYIIALNQTQLNKLVRSYLNGDSSVLLKGKKRNIYKPLALIIYSAEKWEGTQEDFEAEMRRQAKLNRSGKISLRTFHLFGTNVTDQFTKGLDWGAELENSISLESRPTKTSYREQKGKIFISHAVKDAEIVRAFTEYFLQIGLGLSPKDIFNISIEDSGIISGDDFRKKIAVELKNAEAIILIVTEHYKSSEACLNEMGAAWMLDKPVIPFILEPITFNNIGFIHAPNQLLKLNSLRDLKKFVSENKDKLFTSEYDDAKLDRKIAEFLSLINNRSNKKTHSDLAVTEGKNVLPKETTPFVRLNNHSNLYYLENSKYREIPDFYTGVLLGVKQKGTFKQVRLSEAEIIKNVDTPMNSVLDCKIFKTEGNSACWLVYGRFRHHITNQVSLTKLINAKTIHKAVITIPKTELNKFLQGDSFNLA